MPIDWNEAVNTLRVYTAKLFIKRYHLTFFKLAAHDYFLQKCLSYTFSLKAKKSTALKQHVFR